VTVLLQLAGVGRRYGALHAVDDIALDVRSGSRHALIGPNGAGKTTLIELVSGARRVTAGRIIYAGADITALPAHRRAQRGIIRTWQRPATFDRLTTIDNVILGLRSRPQLAAARNHDVTSAAHAALAAVGLPHRADTPAGQLPYGERRLVELATALAAQPRLLLLDEPSAGLGPAGVAALTGLLAGLPGAVAVLLVDHNLDLVFSLADTITVMHHGRHLATGAPDEIRTNPEVRDVYLTRVGGINRAGRRTASPPPDSPALRVRGLHAGYDGAPVLHDIALDVAAGEIVAVVGRNGAGKTTLLHTLAGLHRPRPPTRVELLGRPITNLTPHDAVAAGIALVPQGRRLFATLTVDEHLTVSRPTKREPGQWSSADILALFPELAARRHHRPGQLSGGEQQMLAIARALLIGPRALLLDEPSEGLAPALIDQLAHVLGELASAGVAVLLAEQNLSLPDAVADRTMVLTAGPAGARLTNVADTAETYELLALPSIPESPAGRPEP